MNILVLTPDGVGSTFLQRALTTCIHLQNKSVCNSHELTNGIISINNRVQKTVPFKSRYDQSLTEIIKILKTNKTKYFISRLAKYHIDNRKDTPKECEVFYTFLNKYFDQKIMCLRKNIFEYALSWSIRDATGLLNTYNYREKIKVNSSINVSEEWFKQKCNEYVKYLEWAEKNFNITHKVYYEDLCSAPEREIKKIIKSTPLFKKKFGISIADYIKKEYELYENINSPTFREREDMEEIAKKVVKVKSYINQLTNEDEQIMPTPLPIKNTSLLKKRKIVKNFNTCTKLFKDFAKSHNWIDQSLMDFDFWTNKRL